MKSKLYKLGDLASIKTGYTFREKVDELDPTQGNAYIVQIKDVREFTDDTSIPYVLAEQLPRIQWEGRDSNIAAPRSVLLPSRGMKGGYFKASILSASELPVIVSSQFLVVTPSEKVLPEYLCWALNQPSMQHHLSQGGGGQGTSLFMLSVKDAKELSIKVPSLSTQEKIVAISQLFDQEQQTTLSLLENRKSMLQGVFQKLLTEGK